MPSLNIENTLEISISFTNQVKIHDDLYFEIAEIRKNLTVLNNLDVYDFPITGEDSNSNGKFTDINSLFARHGRG